MDDVARSVKAPSDLIIFRRGLRDFLRIWDDHFDDVADTLVDMAALMPGFSQIFRRTDRARTRRALESLRRAARSAILDWEWVTLLALRRKQGRVFAAYKVPLEEIAQIFLSFRNLLITHLVGAFDTEQPRLVDALEATDRYIRFSFTAILESYIASDSSLFLPELVGGLDEGTIGDGHPERGSLDVVDDSRRSQ